MAVQGQLRVAQGFLRDKDYILPTEGEFTIGRDKECTLPIMSRRVSRKHAKITYRNGVYSLTDLDSKTGTFLNERRISHSVLRHNDIIMIGGFKFRFLMEEVKPAAPTPAAPPAPPKPVVIPPKPAPPPPPPEKKTSEAVEVPAFSSQELELVGTTIGDIKLIAALNRGRRTLIYKGTWPAHNRVVALKLLTPEAASDPEVRSWFIAGAKRAGELRHEDIVPLLGGGRAGERFYIFSAFMENGSAKQRFASALEDGVPAVKRALESLVHIVRALEYGHSTGILHLGIRPSKILYDENRRAKLSNLGFDNGPSAPGAKITPEVEAYLAPEQLAGGSVGPAADIYSLGACFYYMLTGRRPMRDRRQRIPSPKLLNKAVPDFICRIIEKMTDPAPEARYKSYGQLLHDLRWALRGEAWPHA